MGGGNVQIRNSIQTVILRARRFLHHALASENSGGGMLCEDLKGDTGVMCEPVGMVSHAIGMLRQREVENALNAGARF